MLDDGFEEEEEKLSTLMRYLEETKLATRMDQGGAEVFDLRKLRRTWPCCSSRTSERSAMLCMGNGGRSREKHHRTTSALVRPGPLSSPMCWVEVLTSLM